MSDFDVAIEEPIFYTSITQPEVFEVGLIQQQSTVELRQPDVFDVSVADLEVYEVTLADTVIVIVQQVYPGGATIPDSITFTYNGDGSVAQITKDGEVTTFTYDGNGVLESLQTSAYRQDFAYNPDDSLASITKTEL